MTTQNVTNAQLFSWHNEMQSMEGTAIGLLLNNRIKEFYNKNGIRVKSLSNKRDAILVKYFVIENNKVKMDGEGEAAKPVLLEGKTMEDYEAEIKELMQSETPMHL